MNKKYLVVGIILLGLAFAGGGFLWWTKKPSAPPVEFLPTQTPEPTPTGEMKVQRTETEEDVVEETEEETPSEPTKNDGELIAEAFAKKYNKPLEEVNLTISQKDEPFAQGGISFAGEMSGAMWLAYKEGNDWLIVHDGQGTIPCSAIEPYNFPTEMVPECWDEANSKLITRE